MIIPSLLKKFNNQKKNKLTSERSEINLDLWIKKTKKLFFLFIYFQIISCSNEKVFFEEELIIENINIIDPVDGLFKNKTLVIKENKIIEIFNSNEIKISKKNKTYKGDDKFIIPGLWDSHVHFAFQVELADSMMNLFLYHGITSLRDTGGPFDFVNKFKQNSIKNPKTKARLKIAGPLLDGEFNVYDGSDHTHPLLSIKNSDEEELKKNVELLIEKGVDFLKAYEMLSPDQFNTLTELAKKNGLKLTGHVPLSLNVEIASNLGLNSIEHFRNIELSMTNQADELLEERKSILYNKSGLKGSKLRSLLHGKQRMKSIYNLDSSRIEKVVDILAKNDTWQIPTLKLYKNFAFKSYKEKEYLSYLELLPKNIRENWYKNIRGLDSNEDKERMDFIKWQSSMVKYMHKKGVTFMAGTDAPIGFLVPGLSLHQEIEELCASGLSELEAIKTATINPAKYFNLEESLGRIKQGYIADLIILDKNPLENISYTKSIQAVIKDGYFMNRSYLDSLIR